MTEITPENRAELYREIFEVDKRGAAILDDLVRRYGQKPAVTDGGIDAVLKTYVNVGRHEVVNFILQQVNRANGVAEPLDPNDERNPS